LKFNTEIQNGDEMLNQKITRERFERHHQWHSLTEQELHEEPIAFGARYVRQDILPGVQHSWVASNSTPAIRPARNGEIAEDNGIRQYPASASRSGSPARPGDTDDVANCSGTAEVEPDDENIEAEDLGEGLQHILAKYPPWEGDNIEKARAGPDLKCPDCHMLFDTS
jgi:translation elongation factor EF-1beta